MIVVLTSTIKMLSLLNNAKFQLPKKKSIIFLNSKNLGQSCILHCHLIMSRFIPKKNILKVRPHENSTSLRCCVSPVVTERPVNCNRINKNSQRGVSTMRPSADPSMASLKVWQDFKEGIDWWRRGSSVLSGQKRANSAADSSCCFKSAPSLSNYTHWP